MLYTVQDAIKDLGVIVSIPEANKLAVEYVLNKLTASAIIRTVEVLNGDTQKMRRSGREPKVQ